MNKLERIISELDDKTLAQPKEEPRDPDQFKARLKRLADYGFTLKGDDQVLQAFTADSFETLFTITHEAIGRMNNNEWALKVNQVRKFLKETKKTK